MGLTYEEGKKNVVKGLILLGVVTIIEVIISLASKGHLIEGLEKYQIVHIIAALLMIGLSLYKAYFIIYEFMHLKYEIKGMAMTILLPTVLLIWLVIAFLWDGTEWGANRDRVKQDITEYSEYLETDKAHKEDAHEGLMDDNSHDDTSH